MCFPRFRVCRNVKEPCCGVYCDIYAAVPRSALLCGVKRLPLLLLFLFCHIFDFTDQTRYGLDLAGDNHDFAPGENQDKSKKEKDKYPDDSDNVHIDSMSRYVLAGYCARFLIASQRFGIVSMNEVLKAV